MSLRARLILAAAYLLGVVVIALEVPLALSIDRRALSETKSSVLNRASLVASRINDDVATSGTDPGTPPHPAAAIAAIVDRAAAGTSVRLVVTDSLGRILADSEDQEEVGALFATPDRPEFGEAASVPGGKIDIRERFSETASQTLLLVTVPVVHNHEVIGVVRASEPETALKASVHRSWLGLGLVGLGVVMVGLGLAWLLAGALARPVRRLQDVAVRFGKGELDVRAAPEGPREVATLAGAFNQMAGALAANQAAQRDFVANASHQLRTPLTGLRLRLEAIEADGGSAGEQARKAEGEVDRLAELVDDLLQLARASSVESRGGPVDLAQTARHAVERWTDPARDAGHSVRLGVLEGATVWADDGDLAHVLDNLIENAIRYSPAGTRIVVETANRDGGTALRVEDDGPGIPPEDRDRIFERFYRGSNGRLAGPGTGLGLAIVAELVRRWGGRVRLADGRGTCVEATFKRDRSTDQGRTGIRSAGT
jgi:signal transduction histidine kinase